MKRDFDIVVVGGGITGLGVGLAASRWGFDCAILEQGTLAAGTSANSLRIIHGGLRYLQSLDIRRVLESVREQAYWLHEVPHLIKPLPCMMPLEGGGMRSAFPMRLGGSLYAQLLHLLSSPVRAPRILSPEECNRHLQFAAALMPHGALWWEDALLLDPSAFVRHLRARIESQGAEIHEGCPVELVKKAGDRWNILVKDAGSLSARVVVDARSESGAGDLREERSSSGASEATAAGAMNLEFDFLWEPEVAIGIRTSRRRLFFAVPRDGHTVVGTWYYPHVPSKDRQGAEEARFVEEIREAFGDARFIQGRIIHRDFGLLPMRCRKGDEPELWGRHACAEQDGFVTIRSTKYTTFRLVGEEALTKAARALRKGMS